MNHLRVQGSACGIVFWVLAAIVLGGCSQGSSIGLGGQPDGTIVAQAVEATLTAVAQTPADAGAILTPTPAPSAQPEAIHLPAPLPDWKLVEKPYAQKGNPDAPVTVVEYSDFQCPWCQRFESEVMPQLQREIDAGRVRFVFKQFPILGPDSVTTAQFAECAGAQGDFWKLHDWLFANQASWKGQGNLRELLLKTTAEMGYDNTKIETCLDADATAQTIEADYSETQQYGFRGTPSFVVNGRLAPGFLPWKTFELLIKAALAESTNGLLPAGVKVEPPPDTDFEAERYAVAGDLKAPITIYEFSDYQCPFCQRFFQDTKALLDQKYVDTGKMRFVYKDFPLDELHPQARLAALAAECAGAQDKYWEMHDRLFQGRDQWADQPQALDVFKGYATALGLDAVQFTTCLNDAAVAQEVQSDFEEGVRAGVSGTPTFYINGQQLVGAQPIEAFIKVIEAELAK